MFRHVSRGILKAYGSEALMLFGIMTAIVTSLVMLGLGVVVEASRPVGRRLPRTLAFNMLYAAGFVVWANLLQPLAGVESAFLQHRVGISRIALPERGWGVIFSALVLMLAEDLIFYWVHRAQHRYEFLWAMHSFHHSDDELNVATSHRHYWLEKPLFLFVFYMPLGLVFRISPETASLYSVVFLFFSLFPHMNLRLELGRWSSVLLGPQLHRIHHSMNPSDYNTNFAGAFPVWDILFGTYRAPGRGEFPATGVPASEPVPGLLQTLLWPLRPQPMSQDTASNVG
jgi:sterol desaturase/sphingolipid hydroxylase (fatty acid hydroxylase superfamily)